MSRTPALKFASKPCRNRPEQKLQQNIVQILLLNQLPRVMWHSNVNEGRRGVVDGSQLKKAGMTAGVADLEIIVDGKAHFLEVKAKGEKQSPAQRVFEANCSDCRTPYAVVDNLQDAYEFLLAWKAIKPIGYYERLRAAL